MRRAKNRNKGMDPEPDSKKMTQKCEICRGYDVALAAKEVRGRIKWVCYSCYKKEGAKR